MLQEKLALIYGQAVDLALSSCHLLPPAPARRRGTFAASAAAEMGLGQLAEPGRFSSLSSRTRRDPGRVLGEWGAGEAPGGAGALERMAGTCHPPCCLWCASSPGRSASDPFLLPDPGQCRAHWLPAPQLGKGVQGVSLTALIQAHLPGLPLLYLNHPLLPCIPPLPRPHPNTQRVPGWDLPAPARSSSSTQRQRLQQGSIPGAVPKGLSQGHADPTRLCCCGTSPGVSGGTWHGALATSTRPHTCPAGTLCTGVAHVRWPQAEGLRSVPAWKSTGLLGSSCLGTLRKVQDPQIVPSLTRERRRWCWDSQARGSPATAPQPPAFKRPPPSRRKKAAINQQPQPPAF